MDNDFKFTWSRMSFCFPENKEDMNKSDMEFDHFYPKSPDFSNNQISFTYKNDYGIQMFLNQTIPPWIEESPGEILAVKKMHLDLSHKLYDRTIKELDDSFDILESWRKFIAKNDKGYWEGNLQNHIDFENKGNLTTLWDYYKFYINSDSKKNRPTDILHKIGKLPTDSLNTAWEKYFELSKKASSNAIVGENLTECIKNANEIYKRADELRDLKF